MRFAALISGQLLNFSDLTNDVGVSATTIREYYQILEDILLGFNLPSWQKGNKRKVVNRSKFYFFDVGVMHRLIGLRDLEPQTDRYGFAFEHFIAMELRAYISYQRLDIDMTFWRSKHDHEVDFVGDQLAIEVKTADRLQNKHLKGLRLLQEEDIVHQYVVVFFDPL